MATKPWYDSPPTIVERYELAASTSDLTGFGGMVPQGKGVRQAEILAAAGLAATGSEASDLGRTLMRLESEWDAAAKPARPGPRLLKALAGYIRREDIDAKTEADRKGEKWKSPGDVNMRAVERAGHWYAGELRLLAQSLRSKAAAVRLLTEWAARKGIEPDAAGEALLTWLDPNCPACNGHGTRQIHGQPARQCSPCGGTGIRRKPEDVLRVMKHIDYAVGLAKGGMVAKLA